MLEVRVNKQRDQNIERKQRRNEKSGREKNTESNRAKKDTGGNTVSPTFTLHMIKCDNSCSFFSVEIVVHCTNFADSPNNLFGQNV